MDSRNIYDLEYSNTRLKWMEMKQLISSTEVKETGNWQKGAKFTVETKFKIEKDVKKYYKW